MKPTILAIIGKPLAGKDTQADALARSHPDAVKISTGHILRAVREEGETHRFWPLVGHLMPMMEAGIKLPDPEVVEMLGEVMEEQVAEGKKTLIIAGSPRSHEQLEGFEGIAKKLGANLEFVHVDATDSETYKRSANRNEGRVDDTPEVHAVRLQEFRTHVVPVINTLRDEYRLIEVNGEQPIDALTKRIENELFLRKLDPEITLHAMARR